MGWGHSASLQISVVHPSNELELTQKNWIEGNQKFIFQTQLDKRVWLSLVIELSGAHKRKQVWNKLECSNFELLMAGTLLTTACPKGKLEFKFFASPDHHLILFFKIIVWTLNSQQMFCVQLFDSRTASNSFVWKSSIEISLMAILFDFVWYGMPCFIQSPHW